MSLNVSNVFFILTLFYIPQFTNTQNCAVPRYVSVKPSDKLTETLDTGQILTTIPTLNVVKVKNYTRNPNDFAEVCFDTETQNLILKVNKPLWSKSNTTKSYIDEERVQKIEISVELECCDGQSKEVTFIVPIIDENTELPRFEQQEYNLTAEPCISKRCVFAFETEIMVIDEDRDEENALMEISTDSNQIEVLQNLMTIEPWYVTDSDGRSHKGFQIKLKLAYIPKLSLLQKSISFTVIAKNVKDYMHEFIAPATSNITITFEERPDRILPPVLSSSFYYAHVQHFGETVKVKPHDILATVPWDEDPSTNNIRYTFSGDPVVFNMSPDSGKIKFDTEIEDADLDALRSSNGEVTFMVTAERTKKIGIGENISFNVAFTSVPFVVFFSSLIGDPTNSTTEYPCSPECYSTTTPYPGTCPSPTCPDPEPCPGITEGPEITEGPVEPDPSTTLIPTNPPEPSSTTTTKSSEPPFTTESTLSTLPELSSTKSSEYTSTIQPTTNPHESTTPQLSTSESTTLSTHSTSTTLVTTTYFPTITPTPRPGNCTCNCDKFSCQDPATKPSKNATDYYEYPDPHNCMLFHRCTNGSDESQTTSCPTGQVYCPQNAACETVEDCMELYDVDSKEWSWWRGGYGGGYISSEEADADPCEQCECGRTPPGSRGNVCEDSNFDGSDVLALEDPRFCDIFHKCVREGSGYHDYKMKCPPGLIFCQATNTCDYPSQVGCQCPYLKTFKQCDVCIMGKWKNFDIFTKRFGTRGGLF